jgi:hypothetical protein
VGDLSKPMKAVLGLMAEHGVSVAVGIMSTVDPCDPAPETAFWHSLDFQIQHGQPRSQTIRALQSRGLIDRDGGNDLHCRITDAGRKAVKAKESSRG